MTLHQSLEHVHMVGLILPTTIDDGMLNLTGGHRDAVSSITQAINYVRAHGLGQMLCEVTSDRVYDDDNEDFQPALQKSLRTLLDDIQLEGERIDFEIKVSKAKLLIITLRREGPSKDDTPAPPSA